MIATMIKQKLLRLLIIIVVFTTLFNLALSPAEARCGNLATERHWIFWTRTGCKYPDGELATKGFHFCGGDIANQCCESDNECPVDQRAQVEVDPANLRPFEGPTNDFFDAINPLKNIGGSSGATLNTPGGILSRFLQFAIPFAGLILFVMIVWGGFEILVKRVAGDKENSINVGKQRIAAALTGFILLFISYWLIQIIEMITGIAIL